MKSILFMLILISISRDRSLAQYTHQGQITYERKINFYAQLEDDGNGEWLERMKTRIPKFRTANFELSFNSEKSIYKFIKNPEDKSDMFRDWPASENIVLTDFKTQQVTAHKVVYEKTFLVNDTMRKMQWKIMDEIRTIANYKCRKAVGKICDSVYVIAFYTDDIMVSGGPEMFCGLPGMILELAIPRLHTTWTATKVEITSPSAEDMIVPGKGKKVTEQGLYETIKDSFSDWGKMANRNIWWSLL